MGGQEGGRQGQLCCCVFWPLGGVWTRSWRRERDAGGRQSYLQLQRIVKMIVAWRAPGLVVCSVAQARPSLCDPRVCNPPCASVHRVFKARILEWVSAEDPGDLPNAGIKPASPAGRWIPT